MKSSSGEKLAFNGLPAQQCTLRVSWLRMTIVAAHTSFASLCLLHSFCLLLPVKEPAPAPCCWLVGALALWAQSKVIKVPVNSRVQTVKRPVGLSQFSPGLSGLEI
jgi:hypothetical protein